jgi:AmmeMemoRadiSam system protein A
MVENTYSQAEQELLLSIARQTLETASRGKSPPAVDEEALPATLQAERACFVTLRHHTTEELRGCTGVLVARNPLVVEVIVTTHQTAINDPRFSPVAPAEVDDLHIEISVLTPMEALDYRDENDLIHKLRPLVDGVTLQHEHFRATFLPQVWERVPDPTDFLNLLCRKMGVEQQLWRKVKMNVFTYQTIIVEEPYHLSAS